MRLATLVAGLFLAVTGLAATQPYQNPEALLETFYRPYLDGEFGEDESGFRSHALQALYERDTEITPKGEMGGDRI
ncbi:MAG: hypothetical protein MO852_06665 [Candidatus Devosia euplotis]|nr:hypothetical protein [Candidatus Devosia euplotis]